MCGRTSCKCGTHVLVHHCCGTHVLQAQQSVGEQGKSGHLPGHAGDVARRPEIDDRQVLAHLLPDAFIRRSALLDVAHGAGAVQQFVHMRVRVAGPVQRAAGVQEAPRVAVGVQQAGPAAQRHRVVAALHRRDRGAELHRVDLHRETRLGRHRLDHFAGLHALRRVVDDQRHRERRADAGLLEQCARLRHVALRRRDLLDIERAQRRCRLRIRLIECRHRPPGSAPRDPVQARTRGARGASRPSGVSDLGR